MGIRKVLSFVAVALVTLAPHGQSLPAEASANTGGSEPPPAESVDSLIARAKVWLQTDVRAMDLRTGPAGPGAFALRETVTCDYVDKKIGGATPKYLCRLANGEIIKVKYGGDNGEVYAEVAASRLLWALGFGADHMYSVRVICRGCPHRVGGTIRDNGDHISDPAAVERLMPGENLAEEWHWDAIDRIDESAGGASLAERDAFKLLAVFLQHSDSKAKQHRVICIDPVPLRDGRCQIPLLMISDLGVTFGRGNRWDQQPRASMNLAEWKTVPIWKDPAACVGNLSKSIVGTLKHPVIGEAGRRFLADLLAQLSDQQISDLFESARVHLRPRDPSDGPSGFPAIAEWVETFKQKRADIVDHRCPSSS